MRVRTFVLLVFLWFPSSLLATCSDYNYATGPFHLAGSGSVGHVSGNHNWASIFVGSVFYGGSNPSVPCTIHASMSVVAAGADYGSLTPWYIVDHAVVTSTKGGDVFSNGPSVTADGESAVSVEPCVFGFCGVAPTISGSGTGVGFSVSFPAGNIFPDSRYLKVLGVGPVFPVLPCNPNACCWDSGQSAGLTPWLLSKCKSSPIIVSTREGVDPTKSFTDPQKSCVRFDLKNDGKPRCYSWPKRGSGVAFLAFDRDHDRGLIDSGAELFGNFTPHADGGVKNHPAPNGYLALAWYDLPAQGGNMDLEITKEDQIWPSLRLWIPDHCWDKPNEPCVSLPSELHFLSEFGITSIGLAYDVSPTQDRWGNAFPFYAQLNPAKNKPQMPADTLHERRSWDVFLVSRP